MRESIENITQNMREDDEAWQAFIGPAYTEETVGHLLNRANEEISSDDNLLRLTMRSGEIRYPAFQFDDRKLISGIGEVVKTFTPTVTNEWTIASWLLSPNIGEGKKMVKPIDALKAGLVEEVNIQARRTAYRMSI